MQRFFTLLKRPSAQCAPYLLLTSSGVVSTRSFLRPMLLRPHLITAGSMSIQSSAPTPSPAKKKKKSSPASTFKQPEKKKTSTKSLSQSKLPPPHLVPAQPTPTTQPTPPAQLSPLPNERPIPIPQKVPLQIETSAPPTGSAPKEMKKDNATNAKQPQSKIAQSKPTPSTQPNPSPKKKPVPIPKKKAPSPTQSSPPPTASTSKDTVKNKGTNTKSPESKPPPPNPTSNPRVRFPHIDEFFSRFPDFRHNPHDDPVSEFQRLSKLKGWKWSAHNIPKEARKALEDLQSAFIKQFHALYLKELTQLIFFSFCVPLCARLLYCFFLISFICPPILPSSYDIIDSLIMQIYT
ncbi:hypothetical protein BDN72DRAFT_96372 [Pluteus cervinus]|uniref:Uncharacterized protein n=1 Tax=Pluteus cervinus TaxID=181527 RepID=A0ACD3APQ6_9AGAR|nr:hypothetical protein BDN72DRAFT_96372 [Pluteus cervinus]